MFCGRRDNSRGLVKSQIIAKDNDCIGVLGGGRGSGYLEFGRLNRPESHAELPGRAAA